VKSDLQRRRGEIRSTEQSGRAGIGNFFFNLPSLIKKCTKVIDNLAKSFKKVRKPDKPTINLET